MNDIGKAKLLCDYLNIERRLAAGFNKNLGQPNLENRLQITGDTIGPLLGTFSRTAMQDVRGKSAAGLENDSGSCNSQRRLVVGNRLHASNPEVRLLHISLNLIKYPMLRPTQQSFP